MIDDNAKQKVINTIMETILEKKLYGKLTKPLDESIEKNGLDQIIELQQILKGMTDHQKEVQKEIDEVNFRIKFFTTLLEASAEKRKELENV